MVVCVGSLLRLGNSSGLGCNLCSVVRDQLYRVCQCCGAILIILLQKHGGSAEISNYSYWLGPLVIICDRFVQNSFSLESVFCIFPGIYFPVLMILGKLYVLTVCWISVLQRRVDEHQWRFKRKEDVFLLVFSEWLYIYIYKDILFLYVFIFCIENSKWLSLNAVSLWASWWMPGEGPCGAVVILEFASLSRHVRHRCRPGWPADWLRRRSFYTLRR